MTTLSIKTADAQTLVQDLGTLLSNTSNWSRYDPWVKADATQKTGLWDSTADYANSNDPDGDGESDWYNQGGNKWHNNGYVYYNSQMNGGYYLCFYISHNNRHNGYYSGINFHYSEGWDDVDHRPTGKTTSSHSRFDTNGCVQDPYSEDNGTGVYQITLLDAGNRNDKVKQDTPATYFASAQANGTLTVAGWNEWGRNQSEVDGGAASWFAIGPTSAKIWPDGNESWIMASQKVVGSSVTTTASAYGWAVTADDENDPGDIGSNNSAIGRSRWGFINPATQDDTFIYDVPVVYKSSNQEIPVSTIPFLLPAKGKDGPATGDTVTADLKTYMYVDEMGSESRKNNNYKGATVGLLFQ